MAFDRCSINDYLLTYLFLPGVRASQFSDQKPGCYFRSHKTCWYASIKHVYNLHQNTLFTASDTKHLQHHTVNLISHKKHETSNQSLSSPLPPTVFDFTRGWGQPFCARVKAPTPWQIQPWCAVINIYSWKSLIVFTTCCRQQKITLCADYANDTKPISTDKQCLTGKFKLSELQILTTSAGLMKLWKPQRTGPVCYHHPDLCDTDRAGDVTLFQYFVTK